MRISDWSSDVCSSDLPELAPHIAPKGSITLDGVSLTVNDVNDQADGAAHFTLNIIPHTQAVTTLDEAAAGRPVNLEIDVLARYLARRSEEHTSELQSLMRTSYAVFCLKNKKHNTRQTDDNT